MLLLGIFMVETFGDGELPVVAGQLEFPINRGSRCGVLRRRMDGENPLFYVYIEVFFVQHLTGASKGVVF